jgi:hypothetical protein
MKATSLYENLVQTARNNILPDVQISEVEATPAPLI